MTSKTPTVEFQRRCIIDMLGQIPDTALNAYILRTALAEVGQDLQVDEIRAHAEWLAAAGLVRFVHRDPPVVLGATARGVDVAKGRIVVAGVADPIR